jgi:hypothetical protein
LYREGGAHEGGGSLLIEVVAEGTALGALAAGLLLAANASVQDPTMVLGQDGLIPGILLVIDTAGFVFLDIQSRRRK